MAKQVDKAMEDLNKNKSRGATSGNRTAPKDGKVSDAQHGQTDVDKAKSKGKPPGATR